MGVVKLTLEYDGTGFSGWAAQPGLRTVEGELRAALDEIYADWDRLAVAGRTDAGVHALGQVASFEAEGGPPPERAAQALNGVLPDDVAALRSEAVPEGFSARFSATARYLPLPHLAPPRPLAARAVAFVLAAAPAGRGRTGRVGCAPARRARFPGVHADRDANTSRSSASSARRPGSATAISSALRSRRTAFCATWCALSSGRCSSRPPARSSGSSRAARAPRRARRRRRGGSTSIGSSTSRPACGCCGRCARARRGRGAPSAEGRTWRSARGALS